MRIKLPLHVKFNHFILICETINKSQDISYEFEHDHKEMVTKYFSISS